MDRSDYERTRQLLEAAGFAIDESEFHHEVFGNWFVYVDTAPRLGVVWDARDRLVYVRRETDRVFAGHLLWDDLWSAAPGERPADTAVEALRSFVR